MHLVSHYVADKISESAGNRIGETNTAKDVAAGVLKSIDIVEEQDRKAEEKRKAEDEKNDPMLKWHILGAD